MSNADMDMELASGMAAFEAKHFDKAFMLLSPLANDGNAECQYRLAIMYQNGLGCAVNEKAALEWMRKAAAQNHAFAQHGIGFMYMQGECVEKDEAAAMEWFKKAADQGLPGSQMTIGMMYEQGLGVEQDEQEARRWYAMAEQAQ